MADQQNPHGPGLHREHIHVERKRGFSWAWLLLPIVALGLLALLFMPRAADQQAVTTTTTTTTSMAARTITYKQQQWEIKGAPETFPAGELAQVATSDEGDALFANSSEGYLGGGGGEAVPGAISMPNGRVYLRTADGRFQPLFLKQ
ncbi:MAG: hypothetical protein JWM80_5446 [Cyanobacteria bacterium RYN_339]|nr:hypothetical protein [Cyanobacteria bacterium RYN_339]